MKIFNPQVDKYLIDGCMRCSLGATPQCKVNSWKKELKLLRKIVLRSGLTEELKWGSPCYTHDGANVVMIGALKESCTISFFKGALLNDTQQILSKPGENCQAARLVRFTSTQQIAEVDSALQDLIAQAIKVEREGLKVDFSAKNDLQFPEELLKKFSEQPKLENAFLALTPGRQRGYVLHFNGAKQTKTRESRIEKCIPKIMAGKGFHD